MSSWSSPRVGNREGQSREAASGEETFLKWKRVCAKTFLDQKWVTVLNRLGSTDIRVFKNKYTHHHRTSDTEDKAEAYLIILLINSFFKVSPPPPPPQKNVPPAHPDYQIQVWYIFCTAGESAARVT